VKTRLIPAIGADAAAKVYRQLLDHALGAAYGLHGVRRELWIDGPDDGVCIDYADRFDMTPCWQQGADLGERMYYALATALQKSACAVLIGSDSPEYDTDYLSHAFAELEAHDAVLGPAADGGYLLIGMRRPERRLFNDIPWSTDKVLDLTRRRLAQFGLSWTELPTLRDVDVAGDLAHLPEPEKSYP